MANKYISMTNEEKLKICDSCNHMILSGIGTKFEEKRNDRFCNLLRSLVLPKLDENCPDGKWKNGNLLR